MAAQEETQTAPCDWCGHVMAVAELARFDVETGEYKYACRNCAVRVDPHTMEFRSATPGGEGQFRR